jgi:hypothetical protein
MCKEPAQRTATPAPLAHRLFFALGLASRFGRSLGRVVNDDLAVVAAARRAHPVRHAQIATLTFDERVGLEGQMRAVVTPLRPVVSHSYDHG